MFLFFSGINRNFRKKRLVRSSHMLMFKQSICEAFIWSLISSTRIIISTHLELRKEI